MSIDNNAIVNYTCDNISHIYNSVNSAINEFNDDIQILKNKDLTDSSNTFPSSFINNIPNGSSNGQVPVWYNGEYSLTGNTSIRIGQNAGFNNQKDNSIAIGSNAGRHENGLESISIGLNSGRTHQGTSSIAIGNSAGSLTQGQNSISIGNGAGQYSQKDWGVAIGFLAGNSGQLNNSIAIGTGSGYNNQGTSSVALGLYAGFTGQGANSVSIGLQAGLTNQPSESIVINAGSNALSGVTQSACYIQPIRNVITGGLTSNILCYDNTNKEVVQASNIQYANPVSFSLGNATQTSVNFGTLNTGLFSSSANSINISVAGTQRMDLTGSRLQMALPIQCISGTQSTPQIYFGGNSNSGFYSPSSNNIGITTNGTLRMNVTTSSVDYSLPIKLPTSSGTASNLDYYEETTFASAFTYGNTTIASITMSIVRIGKQTTLYIPISVSQTNTNGSSAIITLNTSFPSRFRPNASITLPFYLNNGGIIGLYSITIFTDGNITIAQNNGLGFPNNTSAVFVANALSWIN